MTGLARALLAELDDDALELLAERLAPRLKGRIAPEDKTGDGWLTTKQAAEYLGLTPAAVHQHTAARTIPFEQGAAGCKCWFLRSELDAWRRGEWQR